MPVTPTSSAARSVAFFMVFFLCGCLTVIRPHAALIHNNDCGITPVEPESNPPKNLQKSTCYKDRTRSARIRLTALIIRYDRIKPLPRHATALPFSAGMAWVAYQNSERLMAVLATGRG